MPTRNFPTTCVATIVTGWVLDPADDYWDAAIRDLYDALDWMTGGRVHTHDLPDQRDICRPHVMAQLPQLAAMVDEIEQRCSAGEWQALRLDLIERLGPTLPLAPIDEAAP